MTSHLRAFYTQLFRNIDDADLKDNDGNYLKAANDVAICIPILEQASEKVIYIPELTYYYNSNTGLNNHKIRLEEQKNNERMLRKRKPYQRLMKLWLLPNKTDLIHIWYYSSYYVGTILFDILSLMKWNNFN